MDYDAFRHWALTCVEEIGRRFTQPDDDWIAVLLFSSPRGCGVAAIDPRCFRSGASKDELVSALSRLILQTHATAYALVMELWASSLDLDPSRSSDARSRALRRGALLPEDVPQRQEMLWVTVTDDLHEEIWMAPIHRLQRQAPRLGRWERIDLKNPRDGVFTGRFIEPLRDALQRARASNN